MDDIPVRDVLLCRIYDEMEVGVPWLDAIRKPAAACHGERVAEYAYLNGVLGGYPRTAILDVGCVLNNPIIAHRVMGFKRINFLNPCLEPVIYTEFSYFKMSLDRWFADWHFPLVTCISTLEHIGFDNTRYGIGQTDQGWDWPRCVEEFIGNLVRLTRMVSPGGRLIVTCPYGRREFVHLPPVTGVRIAQVIHWDHVQAIRASALFDTVQITILRLDSKGWHEAEPCDKFEPYGSVGPGASGLVIMTWTKELV